MGSLARIVACGTALSVAACAAIAGLEEPQGADLTAPGGDGSLQDASNGSSSSGSSTSSTSSSGGSSGASDATTASDGPSDAPAVDACTLGQNDDPCTKHSECCSKKCNEEKKCVSDCEPGGSMFSCDPFSTSDCCVGFWCSAGSCAACIGPGQPSAQAAGVGLAQSCCSRALTAPFSTTCL